MLFVSARSKLVNFSENENTQTLKNHNGCETLMTLWSPGTNWMIDLQASFRVVPSHSFHTHPTTVIYKAFSSFYQLVFCSFILHSELAVRNESWDWVLLAKDCVLFTWRCWPLLADRPCVEIRWRVFADAQRVRGCRNERPGRLEVWVVLPQHFPGKLLTPTPYSREKERPVKTSIPPSSSQLHSLWKAPPKHWETKRKCVQKRKVLYSKSTVSLLFFFIPSSCFLSHCAFFGAKDWRIGGRNAAGARGPRGLFPKRQPDKQGDMFPRTAPRRDWSICAAFNHSSFRSNFTVFQRIPEVMGTKPWRLCQHGPRRLAVF